MANQTTLHVNHLSTEPYTPLAICCKREARSGLNADASEHRTNSRATCSAIRPSAIGKKNFLFIGHPDAGDRSAIIYSIVVTCARYGIDPLAYVTDMLRRLPGLTNRDDIDALLPVNWKAVSLTS